MGHINLIKETGAKRYLVVLAVLSMFGVAGITLYSTYKTMPQIAYYLIAAFALAYTVEFLLRYFNSRVVSQQIK